MKNLTLILALLPALFLSGCATDVGMKIQDKSPRGITIMNSIEGERAKAFRAAEKHCAKYYKVPRIFHIKPQLVGESEKVMNTIIFKCLKAN